MFKSYATTFCENSWIKLELTQTIKTYYSTFILLKSTCTRYY